MCCLLRKRGYHRRRLDPDLLSLRGITWETTFSSTAGSTARHHALRHALATSNRKQFGGLPWDLELKQALTRAWQRAHALNLRALGVKGVLKAQEVV